MPFLSSALTMQTCYCSLGREKWNRNNNNKAFLSAHHFIFSHDVDKEDDILESHEGRESSQCLHYIIGQSEEMLGRLSFQG